MPQLQVIQRYEDPDYKQLSDVGTSISEAIQKQQALKLTGQYYKTLAKHADTEQARFALDRKSKTMDFLAQIASTRDPATKQMLIKAMNEGLYQGDSATMFHDIADTHKDVQDNYKSVGGTQGGDLNSQMMSMQPDPGTMTESGLRGTQGNLANAQAANQEAEAAVNRYKVAAMQDPAGYFKKMAEGMSGLSGTQGGPGVADGSDQGNTSNAPLWTGGNVDTPFGPQQYTNPRAERLKAQVNAEGSAQGKQNIDLAPIQQSAEDYITRLDKATKEVGGSSGTEAEARYKALMGTVTAPFTKNSNVTYVNSQVTPLGLQLGSIINKGRPTDKDALAGEAILPRLDRPKLTNDLLKNRLRQTLQMSKANNSTEAYKYASQSAEIARKDQEFVQKARAHGYKDADINSALAEIHKQKGY